MKLRRLELKDAPLMLEWMHDKSVVENLRADFVSKTLKNCVEFIESSQVDKNNLHLAIVDASDDYMGTISLKHIKDGTAEFGIVLRSVAIGKGYSKEAMQAILNKGFNEMRLSSIYWCVNPKNKRAIRFYEKNGYQQISPNALESSHIHLEQGGGVRQRRNSEFLLVLQNKINEISKSSRTNLITSLTIPEIAKVVKAVKAVEAVAKGVSKEHVK